MPVRVGGQMTNAADADVLFLTPGETSTELKLSKRKLRKLRRGDQGPRFVEITRTTILYFRVDVLEAKKKREGDESTV